MAFLIGGANSAADTAFSVANSCRFNKTDNAYHSKSLGAPTDADKFTISFWMKLGLVSSTVRTIFNIAVSGGANTFLQLTAADLMVFGRYDSGYQGNLTTNQVFRDPSAWYSIIVVYDSGNATAGNRMRLYVNGTEVTSFGTDTNPTQDLDSSNIDGATIFVGAYGDDDEEFDGYLAEFCLIDGLALTPSSFGEFDEDSPTIWKPKDVSGLTFGNNGFYLDFEDSANLGNDANGGTDLTETNLAATDSATDTPTNNFCTWNPLDNYHANSTFSEGNLKLVSGGSGDETYNTSTFGLTAGKWYVELKHEGGNNTLRQLFGVTQNPTDDDGQYLGGDNNDSWGYYDNDGKVYHNNSDSVASYDTWTTNDIIGLALDLDNNRLYFAKNGTWQGSSDPTDGTNAISIDANYTYFIAWGDASVGNMNSSVNFGSPPYANSSDAADENGYGAFEYAPPSGYLALCTKNLGSDGG